MHNYTVPRDVYDSLLITIKDKQKVKKFVSSIEKYLTEIDKTSIKIVTERIENMKPLVKEDLRKELLTRAIFEERMERVDLKFENINNQFNLIDKKFNSIDERFKSIDVRFNSVDNRFEKMQKNMDNRFDSMQNNMDNRFDSMQNNMDKRFDSMKNDMDKRFESMNRETNNKFSTFDERIDARFSIIEERLKSLNFRLTIFLTLAMISLTFANPAFVKLISTIFTK